MTAQPRLDATLLRLAGLSASFLLWAGLLYFGPLQSLGTVEGAPFTLNWMALALLFAFGELLEVPFETRGEAHSLTFIEVAYVLGLALAAPPELVIGRVVGGVLVLTFVRRQSAPKLITNVSIFAAESATAAWVFHAILGDAAPPDFQGWVAIVVAMLCAHVVGVLGVTVGISITSGWPGGRMVKEVVFVGGAVNLANTAAGIAMLTSLWEQSNLGILLLALGAVLFGIYRAYRRLTERHRNLETLHEFTRTLAEVGAAELEEAVASGARSILRGEQAILLLPPQREDVPGTRLVLDEGVTRARISPTELAADLTMLLPDNAARLFEPGEPLPGWLGEIGVKDAAIVPLATDGETVGAMIVANRLTEVSTFVDDDLRLFETLANHAGVALANGRLVATLQHDAREKEYQALHDPVTGLPNRTMLEGRLGEAIADAQVTEVGVALVFVDLVTFKEVNDTLGITTGDRLLVQVRQRIEALLPEHAELARLTGYQFALLITSVVDHQDVTDLAETIVEAFDSPFTAGEVSLVLGAELGVALYPEHAPTAELLFQRADAATYRARQEGSSIEVYAADTDPYAPRRLALAADLREALEQDEVDVYVQPKVSLADGAVLGAEALVRWTHPRMGPLSPDQFIPAAEHTGVIRQLTAYVVREALAQCRSWRDAGMDLGISVNLSGRNLFDSHLVEDMMAAIADAGVPPSALTLELTESTVMGETHRSMAVLEGLQALGVRLSIDDFGTGYSSLTHLRSLPVGELKIDKSFVMTMTNNDQDAVIVRTLVDLGRSLGLRTVAEGVESQEARELLRAYGCNEGQGYLFSRPLPAEQFMTWLSRQEVRRIDRGDEVVLFTREHRRAAGGDAPR